MICLVHIIFQRLSAFHLVMSYEEEQALKESTNPDEKNLNDKTAQILGVRGLISTIDHPTSSYDQLKLKY